MARLRPARAAAIFFRLVDMVTFSRRPSSDSRSKARWKMGVALFLSIGTLLILVVLFLRFRYEAHRVETLEEFAAELPAASYPSPATYTFVASVDERLTADEKLALLYASLKERWRYVPDPAGQDEFEKAEVTLSSPTPQGDCEDFAAAMVSVSKALNLTHRVWLGESARGGHVWVEVYITRKSELDPHVRERLLEFFKASAEIVHHADGFWLRLATPGALNSYRPTHFIDITGRLHPASEVDEASAAKAR